MIATAIHNGNEVRASLASQMKLDPLTRRREEDAYTELLIADFPTRVVVHRSRFEVDINRPRSEAVYGGPDDAWGLDIWSSELSEQQIETSLRLHDGFYEDLAFMLDHLVDRHGGFVLFDVHSYNHRRNGPDQPPEDPIDNPQVNLGTGTLPERWGRVAKVFLESLRVDEIDARENVKFEGRRLAEFVHERYGDIACALAIEFRKDYLDEWTRRFERVQPQKDAVRIGKDRRAGGEILEGFDCRLVRTTWLWTSD